MYRDKMWLVCVCCRVPFDAARFTGLIFEHLLNKFDKSHKLAAPYGREEREAVQYWLHYSEGIVCTLLLS